jgi:hypothetical protein
VTVSVFEASVFAGVGATGFAETGEIGSVATGVAGVRAISTNDGAASGFEVAGEDGWAAKNEEILHWRVYLSKELIIRRICEFVTEKMAYLQQLRPEIEQRLRCPATHSC